jgi:hypothetical protein
LALAAVVCVLGIVVVAAGWLPAAPDDAARGAGGSVSSGTEAVTPVGANAPTRERSVETATATPAPPEIELVRCEDCLEFFSLSDPRVEAGSRTTVNSTLTNPFAENITRMEMRLVQPTNEVSVEPSHGQYLDVLEPNETARVTWDLSAIDSASGAYDIVLVMRYRVGNRVTYGRNVVEATVTKPPLPADCEEPCEVIASDRTVRVPANGTAPVPATIRNPYDVPLTNVELIAEPHGDGWGVTPANATRFDAIEPGASREAEWNLTAPASAAGEYSLVVRVAFTGPDGAVVRVKSRDVSVYVVPPETE